MSYRSVSTIFQTFYDKLPDRIAQVMPVYDKCFMVTFLTPRYMILMEEKYHTIYENFDYICSDGASPIKLNQIFGKAKSTRISFDMSSLAGKVLTVLSQNGKGLYVLGTKQEHLEKFITVINDEFKGINIVGYHNGYIKGCEHEVVVDIMKSGAEVVIIGMGAPLQDIMAVSLKNAGFIGSVYTCGGFIHQASGKLNFWPDWANKYNLRWFYRYFCEKGTIKRLPYSILSLFKYSLFLAFKCKK